MSFEKMTARILGLENLIPLLPQNAKFLRYRFIFYNTLKIINLFFEEVFDIQTWCLFQTVI